MGSFRWRKATSGLFGMYPELVFCIIYSSQSQHPQAISSTLNRLSMKRGETQDWPLTCSKVTVNLPQVFEIPQILLAGGKAGAGSSSIRQKFIMKLQPSKRPLILFSSSV